MVAYRVEITRTAEKQLRDLPRGDLARVVAVIESLSTTPRPHGCKKLSGFEATYRVRVGVYRVIYDVLDDRVIIVILKIGHRKDIYR